MAGRKRKDIGIKQMDAINRSVHDFGCENLSELYEAVGVDLGVSENTLRARIRENVEWKAEIDRLFYENSLIEGAKSVRRLARIRDIEYDDGDHDGQRVALQSSGILLARADKRLERDSRERELERELSVLEGEVKELRRKVSSDSVVGGGYVLPVYVVECVKWSKY